MPLSEAERSRRWRIRRGQDPERLVPVAPLAEAIQERVGNRWLTWSQIGRAMGWTLSRGRADTSTVQRALGLRPGAKGETNRRIDYETAVRLARAAGLDPVEVGL